MAYIGNTPAENYASFETETFTVSATASYTLSHAVANENEIRLVINGVVQQPGSGKAYTASGTTLTLSSATASGDVMYAVYLGRALQTVNPPNASVGTAQISSSARTTNLLYPAFIAYNASTQSIPNATYTNYQYETEVLDTDNGFDTSTYTYTIPTAGKYFIAACAKKATGGSTDRFLIRLNKNGSENFYSENYSKDYNSVQFNTVLNLSANDTLNVMVYQNTGGSVNMQAGTKYNVFYAYRIGA